MKFNGKKKGDIVPSRNRLLALCSSHIFHLTWRDAILIHR